MAIFRLSPDLVKEFAFKPEVGMSTQVGTVVDRIFIVASGRLAIQYDDNLQGELESFEWLVARSHGERPNIASVQMDSWLGSLTRIDTLNPMDVKDAYQMLAFIPLGPRYVPPPPKRPMYIYGHLPFHGICDGSDVFYRYEQFSTSLRVDVTANQVTKPDTYAAPASERDFIPTGLSAVARCALPLLLPACWRYELTPAKGTRMYYGASVPLYGQSGGAVEVMFPRPFANAVQIPKPVVLPIL
jgi:hypothetical protein